MKQGVIEIMLLGQNVNSYGKLTPGELSFAQLLARVRRDRRPEKNPLYHVPSTGSLAGIDRRFCDLGKPFASICICRSSRASDTVLARMRRGYTRSEYLERIERLRERCPEVALSTDIIVGFPGETDAEFDQTLELLEQVQYDEILFVQLFAATTNGFRKNIR